MWKRWMAAAGLLLILALYAVSLVTALLARPEAHQWFMASLVATVFLPVLLWAGIRTFERVHGKDGISVREMNKINRRLKKGESPEQLAKEIEEKYSKNQPERM